MPPLPRCRRWIRARPNASILLFIGRRPLSLGLVGSYRQLRYARHPALVPAPPKRAHLHVAVKIDDVLVGQPYAAGRNGMSDPSGLVGAVDAIERVLAL